MIDIILFITIYFILTIIFIIIATTVDIKLYFKKDMKHLVEDNAITTSAIKREYFWNNTVVAALFTIGFWVAFFLIKFGVIGLV